MIYHNFFTKKKKCVDPIFQIIPIAVTSSTIFSILTCSLFLIGCSKVANKRIQTLYSDNSYIPIPKIDLSQYKSPQLRPNQNDKLTIGISISGGGSRAQYFSTGVLIGMDDIKSKNSESSLLAEIDYYSTVSGGGFGAGYYLSMLNAGILHKFPSYYDFWKSGIRENYFQEHLYLKAKPLSILRLRKYETNGLRKSYPSIVDEHLLQHGKEYSEGQNIPQLFLKNFFIDKLLSDSVLLPMIIANGTVYNNAERFPFMPHVINALQITGSYLPEEDFDTTKNGYGMPLAYALTGSAAFPGILPMLSLKTSLSNKKSLRIIDGGAVDNLGYRTLFEILQLDKNSDFNKRAIIVDCGGLGREPQLLEKKRMKIPTLLDKMLQYCVDVNLIEAESAIPTMAYASNMSKDQIVRIGLHTLKEEYIKEYCSADSNEKDRLDDLKRQIKVKKWKRYRLYEELLNQMKQNNSDGFLSEIPTMNMASFNLFQKFLLFELAAQTKTKIAIGNAEKEILVLAGRYSVYLKEKELLSLLDPKIQKY